MSGLKRKICDVPFYCNDRVVVPITCEDERALRFGSFSFGIGYRNRNLMSCFVVKFVLPSVSEIFPKTISPLE